MRVLYDHQMFSIQRFGGITKYFSELFTHLPGEINVKLSSLFSDNFYLGHKKGMPVIGNILPHRHFKGKHTVKNFLYFINEQFSKRLIKSGNYDLFHPTFYDDYFLSLLRKPYIVTVHDLIELKCHPRFETDSNRKGNMVKVISNANRIIAISRNTMKDLMEILNIKEDRIDVIYHGYSQEKPAPKISGSERYILFVGRRGFYKNFKAFAEAMSPLLKREKDLKLICAGDPFTIKESDFLRNLGILDRTFAKTVTNGRLQELYANAQVFVFPSLYEGFGLPILEAFANECPVCLGNSSCFPEIAGDAGCFFDPGDRNSILFSVERVLNDREYASELVTAGKEQLNKFSWENTGRETADAYKKALM